MDGLSAVILSDTKQAGMDEVFTFLHSRASMHVEHGATSCAMSTNRHSQVEHPLDGDGYGPGAWCKLTYMP